MSGTRNLRFTLEFLEFTNFKFPTQAIAWIKQSTSELCTLDEWRTFSRFIFKKFSKIRRPLHFSQFNFSVNVQTFPTQKKQAAKNFQRCNIQPKPESNILYYHSSSKAISLGSRCHLCSILQFVCHDYQFSFLSSKAKSKDLNVVMLQLARGAMLLF